jgi:hypothetical protein
MMYYAILSYCSKGNSFWIAPEVAFLLLLVVSLTWLYSTNHPKGNAAFDAPIVGSRWAYLGRLRYLTNATALLQGGYQKVGYYLALMDMDANVLNKYRNEFFKINGNDMLVVPNKYISELRAIPEERLSSMIANIEVSIFLQLSG